MAGLGFFYGFLVSLTCANLVFTGELVALKEGERWGRGYVRNKQSSEGLCQGLARLVLLSPTCSKMRGRKVQHALWNSVGFDCNSQKKNRPYSEYYRHFVDIMLKRFDFYANLRSGKKEQDGLLCSGFNWACGANVKTQSSLNVREDCEMC